MKSLGRIPVLEHAPAGGTPKPPHRRRRRGALQKPKMEGGPPFSGPNLGPTEFTEHAEGHPLSFQQHGGPPGWVVRSVRGGSYRVPRRPSPPAERPAHPRPGVQETEMRPWSRTDVHREHAHTLTPHALPCLLRRSEAPVTCRSSLSISRAAVLSAGHSPPVLHSRWRWPGHSSPPSIRRR